MTYAEKLKDPRWIEFRERFLSNLFYKRREVSPDSDDDWCEGCGLPANHFHVHHRIYIKGREPWEYSFDCLSALCPDCHKRVHRVEKIARALILESEPHVLYELEEFFEEFAKCENRKLAARCAYRGAVRVQEAERSGARMTVSGIRDMARGCVERYSAILAALDDPETSDFEAQTAFYAE